MINHVEQTQERLIEVQQGIYQVNKSMARFDAAGERVILQAAPMIKKIQAQAFGS